MNRHATALPTAAAFVPESGNLQVVCQAAAQCRGCDLFEPATQTVFGTGDPDAHLMLVGEQPGDDEDVAGEPFVGPAGRLLDDLLDRAGIARDETWLTNAVKHFKFEQRGEKRIHQKPTMLEVTACRPWLDAEIEIVAPEAIVALGATAAQALLGSAFRVSKHRGEWQFPPGLPPVLATWHPSAALRAPDHDARVRLRAEIAHDLELTRNPPAR